MKCDDVRRHLPDLALGDLDAEPRGAVGEHLEACAPCRSEREALGRAVSALGAGALPLAPSTRRREAAVQAMARAHAERPAARPFRGWLPWAAAAAAFAALGLALLRPAPPVLAAVSGTADLDRGTAGRWTPLAPGDVLRPGDRLIARGELRLSLEGGTLVLDPETALTVLPAGRVSLDLGRVRAEFGPEARRALTITDTGNNSVTLRRGRIEAALRRVPHGVAGARQEKDGARDLPAPRMESAQLLVVVVSEGEADLDGSYEQRVRLKAGQKGMFSIDGQPSAAPLEGPGR